MIQMLCVLYITDNIKWRPLPKMLLHSLNWYFANIIFNKICLISGNVLNKGNIYIVLNMGYSLEELNIDIVNQQQLNNCTM